MSDSVEAVKYCAKEGLIDGKRVAITGGSAGGYTVLASLAQSDVWSAGISSYGIGDLKLLAYVDSMSNLRAAQDCYDD